MTHSARSRLPAAPLVAVPLVFTLLVVPLLAYAAGTTAGAAPPARPNLLANGGFEDWSPLSAEMLAREDVQNVELLPPGQSPTGWIPLREVTKNQGRTASIALDEQVKHDGARSLRITNGDPRDISCLLYTTESFPVTDEHNVRPNHHYRLRWWVKGQNVQPAEAGPILMLYTLSLVDGKTVRTDSSESGPPPRGTFDWQQRQFEFTTDDRSRSLTFTLQLRWATGTVWYDDVELVDLGPVVHVETY